ncbi:hypothetical protein BDP27DRAFT_1500681 [Rhodocollybia butyracea]|uniref:Uncharacterized protein n=1 Tax=Rhodocollybia butyracea TaxID=206335 RepID=A0A9P5P9K8_9AGAR|nr:hypothetical protein BDP27DRAFT_1500681 [Rhodocollybia butyracea]
MGSSITRIHDTYPEVKHGGGTSIIQAELVTVWLPNTMEEVPAEGKGPQVLQNPKRMRRLGRALWSAAAYGSALVVVAFDTAVHFVLGIPTFVYTFLLGLVISTSAELAFGSLTRVRISFKKIPETFKTFMAVHLTIPADPKDEDLPFPNGESIKLANFSSNIDPLGQAVPGIYRPWYYQIGSTKVW